MHQKLFTKGSIGRVRLHNRIVMTSMTMGFAALNGEASDTLIRHYEERAKHGVGLIMSEIFQVNDRHGVALPRQINAANGGSMKSLTAMTTTVHRYGTKIFAQLHHGGNTNKPELNGGVIYSASDVPTITGIIPAPFTTEQVKELIEQYVAAAVRMQMAGFDGVNLHAAHGYLLTQFMGAHYNKRTDEYGGSFENRMRMPTEIIQGIRAACGPDFGIVIRMNGEEFLSDKQEGTITLEEGVRIAKAMEAAGVDGLDVSVGTYFSSFTAIEPYSYAQGWRSHVTRAIKEAVGIPVIGTNTIKEPRFAEQLLADGVSDFVGVGRSQLCDPQWSRKAKEGRDDEIRQCLGCLYCFESLGKYGTSVCTINPKLGKEALYDNIARDGDGKPVAVVGGGPAGMQAALVLARRGYAVTLYERSGALGGSLNLADKVDEYKGGITRLVATMTRQMELAGVTVRLNTEATPELVAQGNPVGVFLAVGAEPIVPKLPGVRSPKVHLASEVLEGKYQPGGHVAVIGSGLTGLETAEKLHALGAKTSIVEMLPNIGPGIYPVILMDIMGRLNRHEPAFYAGHRLEEITESGVRLTKLDTGESVEIEADEVVLAIGVAPKTALREGFDRLFDRVIVIGDASRSGKIYDAITAGQVYASGF